MSRCVIAAICVFALATAGCAKRGRYVAQVISERVSVAKEKASPQPRNRQHVGRALRADRRAAKTASLDDKQAREKPEGTRGVSDGAADATPPSSTADRSTPPEPPPPDTRSDALDFPMKERRGDATSRAALAIALAAAVVVMTAAIIHLRRRTHA